MCDCMRHAACSVSVCSLCVDRWSRPEGSFSRLNPFVSCLRTPPPRPSLHTSVLRSYSQPPPPELFKTSWTAGYDWSNGADPKEDQMSQSTSWSGPEVCFTAHQSPREISEVQSCLGKSSYSDITWQFMLEHVSLVAQTSTSHFRIKAITPSYISVSLSKWVEINIR